MPAPHRFTRAQLEQYFDRVGLPASNRIYDVSALDPEQQLSYLALLQKHYLIKVPFENLLLHYSWHRTINVDPEHLFDKIVLQPGRGGYCMENNTFFHVVLLTLGFDVYMVPSRVYDDTAGAYGGLTHCLNIITIAETPYAVDVSFGGNGPIHPLPLEKDRIHDHIQPGQMQLRRGVLPGASKRAGEVWFYDHRIDENAAWTPTYCFVDTEILPADVRAMNFAPWHSPNTIFRRTILCVIFTSEDQVDENGELRGIAESSSVSTTTTQGDHQVKGGIDGAVIILGNNMKWRRKGDKKMDRTFKNDRERVEALEKYFGIILSQKDKEAIVGTTTEVPTTRE